MKQTSFRILAQMESEKLKRMLSIVERYAGQETRAEILHRLGHQFDVDRLTALAVVERFELDKQAISTYGGGN